MVSTSKLRLGCYGSLLAVVLSYFAWVSFPPSRYEAQSTAILKRQQENFSAYQKLAADPTKNAFSDPVMVEYWGRKNKEYRDHSKAQEAITALARWGSCSEWKDTQLGQALGRKEPAAVEAVTAFEKLYPHLSEVIRRPHFVATYDEPPSLLTIVPNLVALRKIAQALSCYSEVCMLRGQQDKALQANLQIFELGHLLTRQNTWLIQSMLAVANQGIGSQTLCYLLQQSSAGWPVAELEKILLTLEKTQLPSDMLVNPLEAELYGMQNSLQAVVKGDDALALRFFPGLLQREWRLYKNDYLPMLLDIEATGSTQRVLPRENLGQWLLGQHGYASAVVIPNLKNAISQSQLARQRQAFLHLYVKLLILKSRGHLPATLAQLVSAGFKPLGDLDLDRVEYRVKPLQIRLKLEPELAAVTFQPAGWAGSVHWDNLLRPEWVLPRERL
ncbi:hypothetical protein IV102_29355 [bacterium]|nr:hypothetical protein [bacterium]